MTEGWKTAVSTVLSPDFGQAETPTTPHVTVMWTALYFRGNVSGTKTASAIDSITSRSKGISIVNEKSQ